MNKHHNQLNPEYQFSYPEEINNIINSLLTGHKLIFKDKLVGSYIYGSLVWGDFDINTSDIDTLCVLSSQITADEIEKLLVIHEELVTKHPNWNNRIEVHYAFLDGLRNFRKVPFKMGNISPGEPLHIIDAGIEWLDEWYCVQEYAITLYGIDKTTILPHIEKSEFIHTICSYADSFRDRITSCRNSSYSQAYAVLTLCRALYTLKNGEQVSKPAAARWAMEFLPEYKELISYALIWRKNRDNGTVDAHETYPRAEEFVLSVLSRYFT